MFLFMFKDKVVELCSDDDRTMFFRRPCALWGENVVRKYWVRSVMVVVGGHADVLAMCGRMWWYCFRMRECGLVVVHII